MVTVITRALAAIHDVFCSVLCCNMGVASCHKIVDPEQSAEQESQK